MGAYYTKEDITGYISKNTIIPFLFDAADSQVQNRLREPDGPTSGDCSRDDPDRYIYDAVRHGVDIAAAASRNRGGLDTASARLIERRKSWNKPAPGDYALPTEIWREDIGRRQRYEEMRQKLAAGEVHDVNDLITLNLDIRQFAAGRDRELRGPGVAQAFWHAIDEITVLDPTCGSGAFLFAALNILEPLYEACLDRMEAFVEDLRRSGEQRRPEKFADFRKMLERSRPRTRTAATSSSNRIIVNNLFGVDIMEEAVEICKLRLFLKLVAQVEPDTEANSVSSRCPTSTSTSAPATRWSGTRITTK